MNTHQLTSTGPGRVVAQGASWLSSAVWAGAAGGPVGATTTGVGRLGLRLAAHPLGAAARRIGHRPEMPAAQARPGDDGRAAGRSQEGPAGCPAIRVILFTDIEGSTALTERIGDAEARALLRLHERIVRAALERYGGTEVKTLGDGFLAAFFSAARALACAVSVQQAFAAYNRRAPEPIRVRVGLNAGEPIAEEDDLFGTAVIVAARVTARARGGEILVSDVVRQLAAGKRFRFAARGAATLRGFAGAVTLHEVDWQSAQEEGPGGAWPDAALPPAGLAAQAGGAGRASVLAGV